MIDVFHSRFADACGGVAFRVTERPVAHSPVSVKICRLLDGSTPDAGTTVRCGTCGRVISMAEVELDGGYA
jgi:hypothetical protein